MYINLYRCSFLLSVCLVSIGIFMSVFLAGTEAIVNVLTASECDVIDVVDMISLSRAKNGIGLCVAAFAYHDGLLRGEMTLPCPRRALFHNNTVAVCFSSRHPEIYKAAMLASELRVHRRFQFQAGRSFMTGCALIAIGLVLTGFLAWLDHTLIAELSHLR
jgi:hypothetical protein